MFVDGYPTGVQAIFCGVRVAQSFVFM